MTRFVICLDLSLNSSGYAVYDRTKRNKLIDWGTIPNHHFSTDEDYKKLHNIYMRLVSLKNSYYPHHLVIEEFIMTDPNKQRGFKSSFLLGCVQGVAKLAFMYPGVTYLNNKTVKAEIVGHGNADKQMIIDKANELGEKLCGKAKPFHTEQDDEADAVILGVKYLSDIGEWK